jgi:L-amino acid N-acyltransferase YncA
MDGKVTVREMYPGDWEAVSWIYRQAIEAHNVTFQDFVPTFEEWDQNHLTECRFVAVVNEKVVGFVAINSISGRECYKGVVDLSIYLDYSYHHMGIGGLLMQKLIEHSERKGFWTLQAGIFEINKGSIRLHEKYGFRVIGYRERVAKTMDGEWMNTVLLERRSKMI